MIRLELIEMKNSFFFKSFFGFGSQFERDKNLIKGCAGSKFVRAQVSYWLVPILKCNIKRLKSQITFLMNPEIFDEIIEEEHIGLYMEVIDYGDEVLFWSVYDQFIVDCIRDLKRPMIDRWDGEFWHICYETWDLLKIDIVQYLEEIGENYMLPNREDIEKIMNTESHKTKGLPDISEEDLKILQDKIREKYPFLRGYQVVDVAHYIWFYQSILNANDMGLGKTIETGAFIDYTEAKKVLIICPSSLKVQWQKELKKFFDLESTVIRGTKAKREKIWAKLLEKKYIIITNYENLRTEDFRKFGLDKILFDVVVYDEITKCKNYSTQNFKQSNKLRARKRIGLTGTPIENHLIDIFTIMKIIKPDFFGVFSNFKAKYLYQDNWGGFHEKSGASRNVGDDLKNFWGWIRWNKSSVLKELPEVTNNVYTIEMTPKEKKEYWRVMEELRPVYDKEGHQINMKNILPKLQALRRLCSEPSIYFHEEYTSQKKKEFVRVVRDNINGKKILCFSQYKDVVYLYAKALEDKGIKTMCITGDIPVHKRDDLITEFKNNPEYKVLLATDSFSYGVNLQFCSIMINIDMHWNPAVLKQRIGRIHRIGQKESNVQIINFLVEDTIEEYVYSKILEKNLIFEQVVNKNELLHEIIRESLKNK